MAQPSPSLSDRSTGTVDSTGGLDPAEAALLAERDEAARTAHLDAQLGALLVVDLSDHGDGTQVLPLSVATMKAWSINDDGQVAAPDSEEALNMIVSMAMEETNGHNEEVLLPDGRTVRILIETVATPMLAQVFVERCWEQVKADLNNPGLCPMLTLNEGLDRLGNATQAAGFWTGVDRRRAQEAAAALERHAIQMAFLDDPLPGVDIGAAVGAETPRRRL